MKHRFAAGVRVLSDQIPRASLRTTLTYRFLPSLTAGIEYNPRVDKVSPIANWLAVGETRNRPALILGTSSDRIGTPTGQSFYGTVSKDLKPHTGLPVAPYAGIAFGTYEDKWRPIGGVNVRFPQNFSSLIIYDGVKVHPTASWAWRNFVFTFLLAAGKDPGVGVSASF